MAIVHTVSLPILGDCTELRDCVLRSLTLLGVDEAMINMVVDERALGAGDGVLDGLELLRNIDTRTLVLDHADDASQVAGDPI